MILCVYVIFLYFSVAPLSVCFFVGGLSDSLIVYFIMCVCVVSPYPYMPIMSLQWTVCLLLIKNFIIDILRLSLYFSVCPSLGMFNC